MFKPTRNFRMSSAEIFLPDQGAENRQRINLLANTLESWEIGEIAELYMPINVGTFIELKCCEAIEEYEKKVLRTK